MRFIEEKLGLIVNVEKSRISRPKELKFLGFGYYYDTNNNNYKVKPHPSSVQKFQRKLRQLTKRNWNVPLDYRILKLNQVIVGWVNYFRVANMKKTTERIDTKLRSRIRVIIWKQWKVAKKQIKSLIQLGIPEEEAKGLTYCRSQRTRLLNYLWISSLQFYPHGVRYSYWSGYFLGVPPMTRFIMRRISTRST